MGLTPAKKAAGCLCPYASFGNAGLAASSPPSNPSGNTLHDGRTTAANAPQSGGAGGAVVREVSR